MKLQEKIDHLGSGEQYSQDGEPTSEAGSEIPTNWHDEQEEQEQEQVVQVQQRGPLLFSRQRRTTAPPTDFQGKAEKWWSGVRAESVAYYRLTRSEIRNNRVGYALGFLACLVVVVVVGISSSVLTRFPVMFAKLGELDNGAADLIFGTYGSATLDYARFDQLFRGEFPAWTTAGQATTIEEQSDYWLSTPRMRLRNLQVRPLASCDTSAQTDSSDSWQWLYLGNSNPLQQRRCSNQTITNQSSADAGTTCLNQMCPTAHGATMFVQDLKREYAMDYGGEDYGSKNIPLGSCHLSNRYLKVLGVKVGDTVVVSFNLREQLPVLWPALFDPVSSVDYSQPITLTPPLANSGDNTTSDDDASSSSDSNARIGDNVILHLKVEAVYAFKHNRKYAKDEVPNLRVDYQTFYQLLAGQLDPIVPDAVRTALNSTDPYHYADTITVNFPSPRLDHYASSDMDVVHARVLAFASPLAFQLQLDSVYVYAPIFDDIWSTLRWMSLFLGLIMNLIIFVLLLLSVILIYSLLMISVENRTFQVGILRMVGMQRRQLVQFLVFQALSFSVPSIAIGIPLAQAISYIISALFASIAQIQLDVSVTFYSVSAAIGFGLLVPIVSSLLPIRKALSHNLHEAIDVRHAGVSAVKVVLERAQDESVSPSMLVVSGLLLSFGFAIYYLFPLSLVQGDLSLLLNIFFSLLLMMLFGFVLLAINFQHWLERFSIAAFFFWEKVMVKQVLKKNLIAHRRRNRLTTILYAISLAFIVFLLVSYDVQIQSLIIQRDQKHGALITIQMSPNFFSFDEIRAYEAYAASHKRIHGIAWISDKLTNHIDISYQGISNLGRVVKYPTSVRTCSPNFFETTLSGFLQVDSWDADLLDSDLLAQLYAPSEDLPVLLGTSFRRALDLDLNSRFLFQRDTNADGASSLFVSRVSALIDGAPLFSFSQYAIWQNSQDTLVSVPTFRRLAGLNSVDDIRYSALLFKISDSLSRDATNTIIADLKAISSRASVWDANSGMDVIKTADVVVSLFFGTAIAVAMVISCFSLTSSMMTNIWEQAKEIGVLRALGVPNAWIVRLYIYESFIVVFASSTIGILIGTFVGWTMSLQRVLFTNLPTPFTFPWVAMLVTVICSFIFAFISSYSPIRNLTKHSIVHNMRLVA